MHSEHRRKMLPAKRRTFQVSGLQHYGDVVMDTMASQITSRTIVYATVYSGRSKKTSKLRVTGLFAGNSPSTGEFPAQMASNADNVSIWWRHHECVGFLCHAPVHRLTKFYQHFVIAGYSGPKNAVDLWSIPSRLCAFRGLTYQRASPMKPAHRESASNDYGSLSYSGFHGPLSIWILSFRV